MLSRPTTRVTLHNDYRFCYICTVYVKYAGHSLRCPLKGQKAEVSNWSSVHQNIGHTTCTFRSRCQQTRHKYKQQKVHVISLTSLQHNTSYTMFSGTFLEVYLNGTLTFEQFITQTTGKTVCILNVLDDDVSIQLLYRNALDIHCKHTASQLHVA